MAVNFYQQPAEANFISQYVPIPFDEIHRIGGELNRQVNLSEAKLDQFRKEYGDFQSLSGVDTADYYDKTKGVFEVVAQKMMANPQYIMSPEGRAEINGAIRNVPLSQLSRLRQNAAQLEERQKLERQLLLAGKYNKDWHEFDYDNFSTANGDVVDLGLVPYKSQAEIAHETFSSLKDTFLGQRDGWDYKGVDDNILDHALDEARGSILNSPEGRAHVDAIIKRYAKEGLALSQQDAVDLLISEIRGEGSKYRRVSRDLNQKYELDSKLDANERLAAVRSGNTRASQKDPSPDRPSNIFEAQIGAATKKETEYVREYIRDNTVAIPRSAIDAITDGMTPNADPNSTFQKLLKATVSEVAGAVGGEVRMNDFATILEDGVKEGVITEEQARKAYANAQAAVSKDLESKISTDIRARATEAAVTGDNTPIQKINNLRSTISQEQIRSGYNPHHEHMRVYSEDPALGLIGEKSKVVETPIHSGATFTTANGIPVEDISNAYLSGKYNDLSKYAESPKKQVGPASRQSSGAANREGGPLNHEGLKARIELLRDRKGPGNRTIPGIMNFMLANLRNGIMYSPDNGGIKYNGRLNSTGSAYVPKRLIQSLIKSYKELYGMNGVSESDVYDFLFKGGIGNNRNIGKELGKVKIGQGKDSVKEIGEMEMVALYLMMPFDQESVGVESSRLLNSEYSKAYGTGTRDAILQSEDAGNVLSDEELAEYYRIMNQ